jgi:hypothetical protein
MNTKRLLLAILATFFTIFATDFLIHGVWMSPIYKANMTLWRSDDEMQTRMGWLIAGQLLAAVTFVLIWAKGFAQAATMKGAVIYGLLMGLLGQSYTFITYAVQPKTQEIVWKWFISGVLQGVVVGIVTFLVYKPTPRTADSKPL